MTTNLTAPTDGDITEKSPESLPGSFVLGLNVFHEYIGCQKTACDENSRCSLLNDKLTNQSEQKSAERVRTSTTLSFFKTVLF